ncbi:glycosyltransferase family 2 protein [Bradyrhizobium sp. 183]|uniref:glycosyltransferase family 2 protein n=1 Tax=unclassified Bradyrhizobium TaxID=2631580 RepID=UPI001FFEA2C3|nr:MULTISPECIES: glycosyltransferase family 2 protein [unclassified Bradyrhizobium]UPJ78945.1 glycosyltransferase family 2 protein [Bradyrhizobium sp. 184]UPJ86738.1 glycosyltransferase family 2 protein [Bradyrhizobium sp. 183]
MPELTTETDLRLASSLTEEQRLLCNRVSEAVSFDVGRVSILIPSYLRADDLRTTLRRSIVQSYSNKEIVVVDDGTPGSTIKDAVSEFPGAIYLRTPKNLGLIGARNYGAAHCTGEFILNLDDDSWLEDDNGLELIVQFMRQYPRTGVGALNIGLPDIGYLWPPNSGSALLPTYKGCGNVYRREAITAAGEYISEFYRQGEEVERSLRIMDAGFEIRSVPGVKVFHAQSIVNRNLPRHLAFEAANCMRKELIRTPLWLLPFGCLRALRFAVRHLREMDRKLYVSELFGIRVPLLSFVRRYRAPVSTSTYLTALKLGRQG